MRKRSPYQKLLIFVLAACLLVSLCGFKHHEKQQHPAVERPQVERPSVQRPQVQHHTGTAGSRTDRNGSNGSTGSNKTAETPGSSAVNIFNSSLEDGIWGVLNQNTTDPKQYAKLTVKGSNLCLSNGSPIQLRGVSSHGLSWFPEYINQENIQTLQDWGANVIRLAMYTDDNNGYCSGGNQTELKALIKNGVRYASDLGMYVIIDWHTLSDNNPKTHEQDAIRFFDEMSALYKDNPYVIYEICNEPNNGTSWQDVKEYAGKVIPVIRKNSPDALVLVGTPSWCQEVDKAAADPLKGFGNVMYTLHFYAATNKDELRNTMLSAYKAGLPIFVSEFGICDASGNGGIDEFQAKKWIELLDQNKISYVSWNLSNKEETSAMLKSSCKKTKGLKEEDLSTSGAWVVKNLKEHASKR